MTLEDLQLEGQYLLEPECKKWADLFRLPIETLFDCGFQGGNIVVNLYRSQFKYRGRSFSIAFDMETLSGWVATSNHPLVQNHKTHVAYTPRQLLAAMLVQTNMICDARERGLKEPELSEIVDDFHLMQASTGL